MATKATKLLQIKVTPMVMKRLHARRKKIGCTMKTLVSYFIDSGLATSGDVKQIIRAPLA